MTIAEMILKYKKLASVEWKNLTIADGEEEGLLERYAESLMIYEIVLDDLLSIIGGERSK